MDKFTHKEIALMFEGCGCDTCECGKQKPTEETVITRRTASEKRQHRIRLKKLKRVTDNGQSLTPDTDPVHPNKEGHRLLARFMSEIF